MAIKASSQVSVLDVTDAYSVTLTSETFTFVGDTSGAPSGLSCTTQVVAYCGTKQCSKVTIGTIICPTGISSTITNNGTISPTITFTTTATITSACEANIPVTIDGITIDKKFSFAVAKQGDTGAQGEPGIDFSQGKMLYTDPTFAVGTNSIYIYNNLGNGTVTLTREAKSSDNPINDSGYEMVCTNTGSSSPSLGGFHFSNKTRANAVFIYRIIAKIPVGRTIGFYSNPYGSGGSAKWLTSNAGTGKFTEYIFKLICGNTGTFSNTGYFALSVTGGFGTASNPIKWYIAYATCFDMTGTSDVIALKKTVVDQGSTLNVLNNKIESKVWSTDIATAFNNLEIGGRNLFLSSKNLSKFSLGSTYLTLVGTNDTATIKVNTTSSGNQGLYFDVNCAKLENNTDYTFSIYVNDYSGFGGSRLPHFSIGSSDSSSVWNGITGSYIKLEKGFNYITFNTGEHTGYFRFFIGIYLDNVDSYLTVSNAKLEKGNKATDWTPAPEDTDAAIDNIQIGGRNYFSSKNQTAFDENNEYALPAYQNTGSFKQFYNLTVPMSYFVGKNCKLSFDAISPNGDTALRVYNTNGQPRYFFNNITIPKISNTWVHKELTIVVRDRGETYPESYSNKIEFYFFSQMGCKIRNVKLEIGNKATDWTPAPEDTESEITSVKTIATQTADKFNWLVQSGTSATDFTLTDRMAELTAATISLNGNVKVNGDMLVDGAITGNKINIEDLFSKNITATNFNITGGSIHINTANSEDESLISLYYNDNVYLRLAPNAIEMPGLGISNKMFQFVTTGCEINCKNNWAELYGLHQVDITSQNTVRLNATAIEMAITEDYVGDIPISFFPLEGNVYANRFYSKGYNTSTYATYVDYSLSLAVGMIYFDITWGCPDGYKIVQAIPVIIDNKSSWNRYITMSTQTITNTGCRLICYASGEANVVIRMNLTFRSSEA